MAYGNIVGQTSEGFSKDEILTGATANKFGLSDAAVPNDVFDFLGKFNLFYWKRRMAERIIKGVPVTNDDNSGVDDYNYIGHGDTKVREFSVKYSESISFDSNGNAVLINPQTVSGSYENYTPFNILAGKYYIPQNISQYTVHPNYAKPGQIPIKRSGTFNREYYLYFREIETRLHEETAYGDWELLSSQNEKEYPTSGIHDGYEYQYVGRPYDKFIYIPKIATGSYIGTGTSGKDNPNELTFDFVPKFLAIWNIIATNNSTIGSCECFMTCDMPLGETIYHSEDRKYLKLLEWGTIIKWYGPDANNQLNIKPTDEVNIPKYYYFAIG